MSEENLFEQMQQRAKYKDIIRRLRKQYPDNYKEIWDLETLLLSRHT